MTSSPSVPPPEPEAHEAHIGHALVIRSPRDLAVLALGAVGVVYGDIGTSPLYAIKECFAQPHGVRAETGNVLGILSLVFWSLTLVIVVKYVTFVLRADNRGEGGTMALLALVDSAESLEKKRRMRQVLGALALFGASLLYGDGIITPAISVLSSIEGLEVATDKVHDLVVPVTVAIIIGLFSFQKRGTASVGKIFGPATLVWFVSIAAAGLPWIFRNPGVFAALNPLYGARFLAHHGTHGFLVLGSVVLCITGGEALYADMGHFGRAPIRAAWYTVVMPSLLLSYFGQGAFLLSHPNSDNPFFQMVPTWAVYPMVGIATVATVVASQAMISGAYSLTQQAVLLGYCPRMTIVHTSGDAEGQIYIPEINTMMMVACVALVFAFQKSSNLAAAYGIAVTGTMTITSILFFALARFRWGWPLWKAGGLVALFLAVDLTFLAANVVKIPQGGWFPLVVAVIVFTVMTTWKKGRATLGRYIIANTLDIKIFLDDVRSQKPTRVRGTAVFMTSNPEGAPPVLLHHFKHNKVLHKQVILLSVSTRHVPDVPESERVAIKDLGDGFYQVSATYGFMQTPNVLEVMRTCARRGLKTDEYDTSFYLGRETLILTGRANLARWRKALFAFLSRNARPANAFFRLPPNRVVELGTQIEL